MLGNDYVVPLAGTWIEMFAREVGSILLKVVPLAGTWIEIQLITNTAWCAESYLSQVRGLKYVERCNSPRDAEVVPLAGTWIEIYQDVMYSA